MNRRSFLTSAASIAVMPKLSLAQSDDRIAHQPVEIPDQGVVVEFGFRTEKGLIIQLEGNDNSRDSFNYERLYYFPAQEPDQVTNGYRQSSLGLGMSQTKEINSVGEEEIYIPDYGNTLRDGMGGEYDLQGSPKLPEEETESLTLSCNFNPLTNNGNSTEELEPLTEQDLYAIQQRINSGDATLYNPPAVIEKVYLYQLPNEEFLGVFFDYSVWPESGIRAVIGSGQDWRDVGGEYGAPDELTKYGQGIDTSEGFLKYDGNPTQGIWYEKQDGKLVEQGITTFISDNTDYHFDVMNDLVSTPLGKSLLPQPIRNPCESLSLS